MHFCVNLCQVTRGRRSLLWLPVMTFLLASACNSSTDVASAHGGAGGQGGTSGANAGAGGVNSCGAGLGTWPDCGTCVESIEDYCASGASCQLPPTIVCQPYAFGSTWERGCGYLRRIWVGDVNDTGTDVWDEATLNLVYHYYNGGLSSGCLPETTAGTKPTCADWADACGQGGAAGAAAGAGP